MAFKLSHILLFVLLWLSIILFLFHEYHYHFKAKIYKNKHIMQASDPSLLSASSSSSSSSHLHYDQKKKKQNRSMSRKVLAKSNKQFDFSPFFKNHHLHHQHLQPPDPSDTQIDPRYGVEKRRVPTGPNPLHH